MFFQNLKITNEAKSQNVLNFQCLDVAVKGIRYYVLELVENPEVVVSNLRIEDTYSDYPRSVKDSRLTIYGHVMGFFTGKILDSLKSHNCPVKIPQHDHERGLMNGRGFQHGTPEQ